MLELQITNLNVLFLHNYNYLMSIKGGYVHFSCFSVKVWCTCLERSGLSQLKHMSAVVLL